MKYTRTDAGVIEVKGCTTCPHMVPETDGGFTVMNCTKSVHSGPTGKPVKRNKKLTSHWTGAYHASCPLPSDPKMVPEEAKK